jgi:hypothetical protein
MQKSISLDDVLASENKFGCVLSYNAKEVRDLKTLNPKTKYDTTYLPIKFKHVNGSEVPLKIKISEIMIGSSAKAPQGVDDDGIPKHLNIAFMNLKRSDIEGGDYVPNKKSSPELQEVENKRIVDNITRYSDNLNKFVKVLEIIDSSYKKLCEDIKTNEASFSFRVRKDRNQKEINVFSIKQVTRLNRVTNKDEKLENPIFRLKVPVCKNDGRVGLWSKYHNSFKPIVFDARRMNKKNNYQPVPAKVKVDGKLRDLDVTNSSSFISYKSLIGGNITFECIVASKFGLSMNSSFYDLYVYRHKAKSSQNTISREEIIQMRGGADENEDEESDVELADEKEEKNVDDDEDEDEDDEECEDKEPVDSDEEVEEEVDEDVSEEVTTKLAESKLKAGKRGKK